MMSSTTQAFAALDKQVISAISNTLNSPLTNAQIDHVFSLIGVKDRSSIKPDEIWVPKRRRIYETLVSYQEHENSGRVPIAFLEAVCHPTSFAQNPAEYSELLDNLNHHLSFAGLRLNRGGKISQSRRASTLDEAAEIADSMLLELRRRHVHSEILNACDQELLQKNLFHGLLEANKSLAHRLRLATGEQGDGAQLVDRVFGGKSGTPLIAINSFQSESDRSEQSGFSNLIKGCFGTWRNLIAHELRSTTEIERQLVLDALTTLSYIHKRLDDAILTRDGSRVP